MSSFGVLKPLNKQWPEKDAPKQPMKASQRERCKADVTSVQTGKENIKQKPRKHGKNSIRKFMVENLKETDVKPKLEIFDEGLPPSKRLKTISTQTECDEEIQEMLASDVPTEKYWEYIAEHRRKALQEALKENKQLAEKLTSKNELIEDLKVEIEKLEEISAHAEYLASCIEEMNNEKEEEPQLEVATSRLNFSSGEEGTKDKSLNTTDGNDQFNGKSAELSDGSCSHDSDKENKPLHFCAPRDSDSFSD